MGHSNGIITAPIGVDTDVAAVLGVSSKDVGTLCTSTAINKWARRKPIRLVNKWDVATDAQFKTAGFGLKLPSGSSDAVTAATKDYEYLRPRGSAYNEPYRITDFINYHHYALPPCQGPGDYTVNTLTLNKYTFSFPLNIDSGTYGIGLNEINPDLMNYYIALVIRYTYNGGTYNFYLTESSKIGGTGGLGITFNLKTDPPFVYTSVTSATYYWVAAAQPKPTATSLEPAGQSFFALPFGKQSDATGTIKITRSTGVNWNPIGVASSSTGVFQNIEKYTAGVSIDGNETYFKIGSSGAMYVEFEVKNSGNSIVQLNLASTNIKMEWRPTFANVSNPKTTGQVAVPCYLRGSGGSYSQASIVNIPANSTINVRIGHNNMMGYYNLAAHMIQAFQKKMCAGTLYYNNTRVAMTMPINLES